MQLCEIRGGEAAAPITNDDSDGQITSIGNLIPMTSPVDER